MKIQFFGAANEVTGSKHLIEVNGKRIFLDFGMHQGSRKDSDAKNKKMPIPASKVDAVVLSHAPIHRRAGTRNPGVENVLDGVRGEQSTFGGDGAVGVERVAFQIAEQISDDLVAGAVYDCGRGDVACPDHPPVAG